MNGIETFEGMSPDQIARKEEGVGEPFSVINRLIRALVSR